MAQRDWVIGDGYGWIWMIWVGDGIDGFDGFGWCFISFRGGRMKWI